MTFAWPAAFVLPLLFLVLLSQRLRSAQRAIPAVPSIEFIATAPTIRQRLRAPVLLTLFATTVFALTLAAARPQRVSVLQEPTEARNIMLSIDISGSMRTADFRAGIREISRLEAVKQVVHQFIDQRPNDRLGLVVFGATGFLQAPLTRDRALLQDLVSRLQPGLAGDGTAIGDGLGLSVKRIADLPSTTKAIVLLTDGVNNSGRVNPQKAAKVAAELGIKVHTIGIGVSSASAPDPFQQSMPDFDEQALRAIASTTGGVYFHARDLSELQRVYDDIDTLETTRTDEPERLQIDELFPWFALLALVALLSFTLLHETVLRRLP